VSGEHAEDINFNSTAVNQVETMAELKDGLKKKNPELFRSPSKQIRAEFTHRVEKDEEPLITMSDEGTRNITVGNEIE
jgi:hypothetical protein